jgi:hypothetical protein
MELVEVWMLLGHSELRVTTDLYTHLVQQTAAKAAQRMDAVLGVSNGEGVNLGVKGSWRCTLAP